MYFRLCFKLAVLVVTHDRNGLVFGCFIPKTSVSLGSIEIDKLNFILSLPVYTIRTRSMGKGDL